MRQLLLAALLLPALAGAAEPTFEAGGQAPIVGGDTVRARERALEEAFRGALERALGTLVDPALLAERGGALKLSLMPRARSFVTSYRVLDESAEGGLFSVRVEAQVATSRLGTELGPLAAAGRARTPSQRGVVCLSERPDEEPWRASPGEARLGAWLERRGVTALSLRGSCAPAAGEIADLRAALNLGQSSGAQGLLLGVVVTTHTGVIRGTQLPLVTARAKLQLAAADGRLEAVAEAAGEAYGATAEAARQTARDDALDGALRRLVEPAARRWVSTSSSDAGLLVEVANLRQPGELTALLGLLRAIPGVTSALPWRLDPSGVEVRVVGAAAGALVAALARGAGEGPRFTATDLGGDRLRVEPSPPTAPGPAGAP